MKKIICIVCVIIFLSGCSDTIEKADIADNSTNVNISNGNIIDGTKNTIISSDNKSSNNGYIKNMQISIDKNLMLDNLRNICSYPRKFGTEGERIALEYLKSRLEEYGYYTDIQSFSVYKQDYNSTYVKYNIDYFKINPYNSENLGTSHNLIGKRDNHTNTKKTILLTAHYDTTADTTGVIDNGTGVSVVLEAARQLRYYDSAFNIQIVFFSSEEYFRTGSRTFISSLSDDERKNIIGCINVDMVGESDAGNLVMKSIMRENNILTLMMNNHLENSLPILDAGTSDDLSFYLHKIPAITLSNKDPNVNRIKDKDQFQYLDLDELASTVNVVTNFLINFDINTYDSLLMDKTFTSNKTIDNKGSYNINNPVGASELDGFRLKKINTYLLENGYDSETEYVYERIDGKKCIIAQKSSVFINPSVYSKYKKLNNGLNSIQSTDGFYHINEDTKSDTKVFYVIKNYYGEIKGDISINEALSLLNSCYKEMYKRIFGK